MRICRSLLFSNLIIDKHIILCFSILLFFLQPVQSKTYYFSSLNGDDSYTSLQAANFQTPWKTIYKLNTIFNELKPGDSIMFNRGEIFEGILMISNSGSALSPIVFGAYGQGSKPTISGLQQLRNWKSIGNGIFETDYTQKLSHLIINGLPQQMGRYPNKGYLSYESFVGNNSIKDEQLNSNINWTGAEVVIRKNRWTLDRAAITSHRSKTINYEGGSKAAPLAGYGYFIQNSKLTLDQEGEWFYDKERKKILLFMGNQNPALLKIQASYIQVLVSIKGYHHVSFENIDFEGAKNTFHIVESKNISINNCKIDLAGEEAVLASYSPFLTIKNCSISNALSGGINLDAGCTHAELIENNIKNIGLFAGLGKSGSGTYEAITSFGDQTLIEKNTLENIGYNGIYFGGNNSTVKNNFINNFCLTKDDGAGIYVGDWSKTYKKKIVGNIVLNGKGVGEGTNYPSLLMAEGIYIDDLSESVSILNNTVSLCANNGIKVHNAKDIEIFNNVVYNNGIQLRLEQDHYLATSTYIRDNQIRNNIFFSKHDEQIIAKLSSHQDDIVVFGELDYNFYCRPLNELAVIKTSIVRNGKELNQIFDLNDWKNAYVKDSQSQQSPKTIPPFKIKKVLSSNKIVNGNFNSDIQGIFGYSPNNDAFLSWTKGFLDGGALKLSTKSSVNNQVIMNLNVGAIQKDKKYALKFTVLGTEKLQNAKVYLRKTNVAYQLISNKEYCKITNGRAEYEMIFSAHTSENDASVILDIEQALGNFYLDNVEFYEVDVDITKPDDYLLFEYNATASVKTIPLTKHYVDVNNQHFTKEVSIPPFSSIILISDGSTFIKKPQTILFAAIDSKTIGEEPIVISAVASSELPVLLNVISGPAEIVEDTKVKFNNAGIVEIEAVQPGNETFEPAKANIKITYEGKSNLPNINEFTLKAFPNPFKNKLQLEFTMPSSGNGKLALYDVQGKLIYSIYDGFMNSNQLQKFTLDADNLGLNAGIYLVRLVTEEKVLFQKVILIK